MLPLIQSFLPGRFDVGPGTFDDYLSLSRFHYRAGRPATMALIVKATYTPRYEWMKRSHPNPIAGVAVLSYPVPSCRERNIVFGLQKLRYGERLQFANRELRTISRVIVHPVFRSTGLAGQLVRYLCQNCPTRYVEALATMGWVHPFFERAGMTRVTPIDPRKPLYYWMDRHPTRPKLVFPTPGPAGPDPVPQEPA